MKSKYLILCVALVAAICGLVCDSTYAQCGANGTAQCGQSLVGRQNVGIAAQLGVPTFGALQAVPVCATGQCSSSASSAVFAPQAVFAQQPVFAQVPQATYQVHASAPLVYQAAPMQTQIDVNALANALRAAAPPVVYQAQPQVYQAPVMAYQAPVYAAAPTMFASLSSVGGGSSASSSAGASSAASSAAPVFAAQPLLTQVALGGCGVGGCNTSRSLSRSRSGGGLLMSLPTLRRGSVSTSRSTSRTITR